MPHPLVNELKIKARAPRATVSCPPRLTRVVLRLAQIQTRPGSKASDNSEYTPQRALLESINDLQTELTTLRRAFDTEATRADQQRML